MHESQCDHNSIRGMRRDIVIGTAGYSYPDWKDVFYPPEISGDSLLEHYCKFFNGLEINSTFYRLPAAGMMKRLSHPAFDRLHLSVKAFRGITHECPDDRTLQAFFRALKPLTDLNRIDTILFQFPYSFRPGQEAWDRLDRLLGYTSGLNPVVEFRHASWFSSEALKVLRKLPLIVSALDMPAMDDLPGQRLPVNSAVGYMRFHGRNTQAWWHHEHAWERYNYLYSHHEIAQMLPELTAWIGQHQTVYFFFNNHYRGQAVSNAQTLMAFLAD